MAVPASSLTAEDLLAVEREACKRSLHTFVREAWHVLEPGQPFLDNWHIGAICEHLEAITNGEITRLLINIPPGMAKSMLLSVMWPAWEWGPKAMPWLKFIGASYEQGLSVRDSRKMRRLVKSEWFQERWPLAFTGDQNEKLYYENEQSGFRQACAIKSMTGRRGDRIAIDDPHSVEGSLSEADRTTALRVFQETVPTRLINPDSSAIAVIMQRLHEEDVSGLILEQDYGYEHLMLPMEFDPERRCTTSLGFTDPRKEEGELLFEERFPRHVIERDKKIMGSVAVAGQFQQSPSPRGGSMFEWQKIETVKALPQFADVIRYWDKAGTQDDGAYSAGVKLGVDADGVFYIADVVRGQWSAANREKSILSTARTDGRGVNIWTEQEPGSGGKESAESTIRNLAGFNIRAEHPTGDKESRAQPLSVQVEAGNVKMLEASWNKDFIDELRLFPNSKYKDQVDAASGAFNRLTLAPRAGVW